MTMILSMKSPDLEEAVSHAVRLDTLADLVDARVTGCSDRGGGRASVRSHTVFAVSGNKQEKDSNADLLKRIAQLKKELKQATKGNKDFSSKKTDSKGNSGRNSTGRSESASADGEEHRTGPDTHPCYICKKLGYWCKDCPKRKNKPKEEAVVQPVLAISANMSPTKIYVTAEINGEPVKCLLDCGCERSVIAADLAPTAKLTLHSFLCSQPTGLALMFLVILLFLLSLMVTTSRQMCLCLTMLKASCWGVTGSRRREPSGILPTVL